MGFNVVQMMLTCRFVYVGVAAQDGLSFTFLDYMSYVFYFPNIIVGTIPFTAYVDFINLQGVYANIGYSFKMAYQTLFKAFLFVAGIKNIYLFKLINLLDLNLVLLILEPNSGKIIHFLLVILYAN